MVNSWYFFPSDFKTIFKAFEFCGALELIFPWIFDGKKATFKLGQFVEFCLLRWGENNKYPSAFKKNLPCLKKKRKRKENNKYPSAMQTCVLWTLLNAISITPPTENYNFLDKSFSKTSQPRRLPWRHGHTISYWMQ